LELLRRQSRIAFVPDEVLDGLAAYKTRDSGEVRCESVQAFHVEHVKLCASRFDAGSQLTSHCPFFRTSLLILCEMDVVFHVERP
jgi:hypothetical protein